jgi:AMMECR1 domain-containing protein
MRVRRTPPRFILLPNVSILYRVTDSLCLAVIRVSLLTNFETAKDYLDWTVGTHGIQITFQHPFYSAIPGSDTSTPVDSTVSSSTSLLSFAWSSRPHEVSRRKYSATYLPDVIPAQQWTKVQAIDSAIRKAGWDGKITDELRRGIQLRRYQSSKAFATWEDYVQWREGQGLSVRV